MRADEMEMQRLGEGGEHPASWEAKAAIFLRAARPTTGLSESDIRAIERHLSQRKRMRPRLLVPVLVALAILLVTGTVMALMGGWRSPSSALSGEAKPSALPSAAQGKKRSKPHVTPMPALVPVAPTEERPAPVVVSPPARREPASHRVARVESSPRAEQDVDEVPAPEGALSVEARSLASALARWRSDGRAEEALSMLAEHDRHFLHGALSIEAKVARAEILLSLSRRGQALAVLDSLALSTLPRARELQTLRGELRAQAGRCAEARADLVRVMLITDADELGQRAARALAICP
jgi:hypothetical protein